MLRASEYREVYSWVARNRPAYYASNNATRYLPRLRPYLAPGVRVLDVGCGNGQFVDHATAATGVQAFGVDIHWKHRAACEGAVADARALPFADRAFGLATAFDVLEHLQPDDAVAAARELRRVARLAIVVVPHYEASHHGPEGRQLHETVRPRAWWVRELEADARTLDDGDEGRSVLILAGRDAA